MTVALVYPPACDPTAPYLAVPMLAGFLRAHGVPVEPVDANIEAFDALLEPAALRRVAERVEAGIATLERGRRLSHDEQLRYVALQRSRAEARGVPEGIAEAKAILRDPVRFFDERDYDSATRTVDAALRAVSCAYYPLELDFMTCRTPFGLLSQDEMRRAAEADQGPFDAYVEQTLVPQLCASFARSACAPRVVGLSVCFPGQLQPAYAFAWKLRSALPGVHLTAGGPALTQIMTRLRGPALAEALGPFDSAVVYEGEHTLLRLWEALRDGAPLDSVPSLVVRDPAGAARIVAGGAVEDLRALPAPDFDGLPLDRYLSPALTLPYDPTRGCYWGRCAFCHYGLAQAGTARYREREVSVVVDHLRALSSRYRARHFYLSQDSIAPTTLVKIADALAVSGLDLRWGTDVRPERSLTASRALALRKGGAVACALGVESGNRRVLAKIDKGVTVPVVSEVVQHLARAGVAVEAMCFTDFPTETGDEAMDTLRFLRQHRDSIAGFIVGEFGLTHGSRVAKEASAFGVRELWQVDGDSLGLALFFEPDACWKSDADRAVIDRELARLARGWRLRPYPWAGAVSTAHTLLHYARFGPDVFRERSARPDRGPCGRVLGGSPFEATARFDLTSAAEAEAREADIWRALVYETRRVSRSAYGSLAKGAKALEARPVRYRFAVEREPARVSKAVRRDGPTRPRRSSRR
jgi:hypothetical protein